MPNTETKEEKKLFVRTETILETHFTVEKVLDIIILRKNTIWFH